MNQLDPAWLLDRASLQDLVHAYCYAVASQDVDAIVELFVPDCWMQVQAERYEGHGGLRDLYAGALQSDPKPFIHNLMVAPLGPDRAEGRCVAEIRNNRGERRGGYGRYDDTFVRADGIWRFESRAFSAY